MSTKVIGGIIVVVVVVAAALLLTRGKSNPEVADSSQSADAAAQISTEDASLKSLMSANKSQTCTFASDEQGTKSEGTVYVGAGKMRGDFNTTSSNVTVASHMVFDGNTAFMWSDGQSTGIKMKMDPNQTTTDNKQSIDPNKNYKYSCKRWSADNAKFELPGNVNFSELPTLPSGSAAAGASSSTDMKAIQQAACANLPEPSKSQCMAAMKQ